MAEAPRELKGALSGAEWHFHLVLWLCIHLLIAAGRGTSSFSCSKQVFCTIRDTALGHGSHGAQRAVLWGCHLCSPHSSLQGLREGHPRHPGVCCIPGGCFARKAHLLVCRWE